MGATVEERLSAIEAEELEQRQKVAAATATIDQALAYDVQHTGVNSFLKGRDGAKGRATRANAEERLEDLARMKQLLAQEAADEKKAAWILEVEQAAEVFPPIMAKAETVYADVARKLAEIVEADWPRLAAVVAEYGDALAGPQNALSEVRSVDPAVAGRFDFAASWPHGQLPANAVEFVNVVLAALVNRVHQYVRAPREVEAVVKPLRATPALLTPPAPLRSMEWDKSALANAARELGEAAVRTAAAFNPPPKPPPTPEQVAEEAERVAKADRWFAHQRALNPNFGRPKGWAPPTPIEPTPEPTLEPDPELDDMDKAFVAEKSNELRRMGYLPPRPSAA